MRKILMTSDGSNTLFCENYNEPYHSIHGALTESMHVFIERGLYHLKPYDKRKIKVLEIGFGSGLNAMLLLKETAECDSLNVSYTGLEPFPVCLDEISYFQVPGIKSEEFHELHQRNDGLKHCITDQFDFKVLNLKLEELETDELFDLVFYDAFGPATQPEMWNYQLLEKSVRLLNQGGIWVSYCAKGEVRRSLVQAGLRVERLPGPPFKRHMIRGIKV